MGAARQAIATSSARLLALVEAGDASSDGAIRRAAETLRSWLVYNLQYRTIEIPPALHTRYRLLDDYVRARREE